MTAIGNWLALLAGLLCLVGPAQAQAQAPTLPDLPAVVDRHMAAMMQTHGVRGAAIVVVHQGRIVYVRGYGHADQAAKRPYDPDTTLANLFSVSKPVSTLAILARAHALDLDLDRDVNSYLTRVQVAPHPSGPITLRRLLSHSAGLSDDFRNEVALSPDRLVALEAHVPRQPPRRRMPVGALIAYGNNNIALAALTVADAAGASYSELLQANLARPAGLASLTDRWPSEAVAEGRYSRLHEGRWPGGRELPAFATNPAPPGGLFATPADMGRILVLLMEGGRLDGRQVVPAQVVQSMLTLQAAAAPGLSGNGLGIRLHSMGGQRFVEHAGENRNALMFLPDQRFGVYLVTTRHGYGEALYPTFRAIAGTWFDLPLDPAPPARPAGPSAKGHAGVYVDGRLVEGLTWRLGAAFAKPATAASLTLREIVIDAGGFLTVDGARFSEISPGLFRAMDQRQSRTGELQWLKLATLPDGTRAATIDMTAMLRLPWYRQPVAVRTGIGGLSLLLTGLTILLVFRRRTPLADRLLAVAAAIGTLALPAVAFAYFRAGDRFVVEAAPEPVLLTVAPWLPLAAILPAMWLGWRALGRRDALQGLCFATLAVLLAALGGLALG